MGYTNLEHCLKDLQKAEELKIIDCPLNGNLELAYIHRRVHDNQGPALWFTNIMQSRYSAVSNLFGTEKRTHFIFRKELNKVKHLFQIKANMSHALKHTFSTLALAPWGINGLPQKKSHHNFEKIKITDLPQIKSWSKDGGSFITLPQVYTENPQKPHWSQSNLGMYRIQLSGNRYKLNQQIGLHYQLHRGIGIHHQIANENKQKLRVSIFIGAAPAYALAAVMPLPENIPEISFAGLMNSRRFQYSYDDEGYGLHHDADFCITGTVELHQTLPEGPFGDHLGYYSLKHPFPVLEVQSVYAKPKAIFPFTVVGRPPQEDSYFGKLIHELTAPLVQSQIPGGVTAVHAVDVAGVHPLLLSISHERYTPYQKERVPREILTAANALLGFGQCSLAKYLFVNTYEDNPSLNIKNIPAFLTQLLQKIRLEKDLHFQTSTTMDTLDYTGGSLNEGSKLVIVSGGKNRRILGNTLQLKLPNLFKNPQKILPGIICLQAPTHVQKKEVLRLFCSQLEKLNSTQALKKWPLIVLVDNSSFTGKNLNNFLWVTFTRSDPAQDIDGTGAFIDNKHWGCKYNLVIDARVKPHHAPILEENPKVVKKIEAMATKGKPLYGLF